MDKETWPRNKVCGDTYLPALNGILEDMGIMEEMASEVAAECIGMNMIAPYENVTQFSLDPSWLIPRRIGDDIIRRAAVRAGADFKKN